MARYLHVRDADRRTHEYPGDHQATEAQGALTIHDAHGAVAGFAEGHWVLWQFKHYEDEVS